MHPITTNPIRRIATGLRPWLPALVMAGTVASAHGLRAEPTIIFQESFETDGDGTRYTVQNPSDSGANAYWARRQTGSTGVRAKGGSIDGEWHWSGRDLDARGAAVDDLQIFEGRVIFNPFSIAGYRNLELHVAIAQGADTFEVNDTLLFEYRVDGGEWIGLGGFTGMYPNSPGWYFEGPKYTYPPLGVPRLSRTFRDFSWIIRSQGESLELRVFMRADAGNEEIHFDNVRVIGDNTLGTITLALNKAEFTETEGAGAGELTITIDPAAPAGGLTVELDSTDTRRQHTGLPDEVFIAASQTTVIVPVDIIHDGRFSDNPNLFIQAVADGYGRNQVPYRIINVDPRPRLLISEIYPGVAGSLPTDLEGDANGDGIRDATTDEFVEFVNLDTIPVDLSGWSLYTDEAPKHFFADGTILQPGEAMVVFAAGYPTGKFGGAQIQTCTTGSFSMINAGASFAIVAGTAVVRTVSWDGTKGLQLKAIVIPDALVAESGNVVDEGSKYVVILDDLPPQHPGPYFSPGTYNDGTPFASFSNEIHVELSGYETLENGDPVTATITLTQPAPPEGIPVQLSVIGNGGHKVALSESAVRVFGTGPVTVQVDPSGGDPNVDPRLRDNPPGGRPPQWEFAPTGWLARLMATSPGTLFGTADLVVHDTTFDPVSLVVNEVFSGVLGSGQDPNRNGIIEEPVEDQYIEIVSTSPAPVNIGGWSVFVWSTTTRNFTGEDLVHVFPEPTWLNPEGSIIVIGGGDEAALNAMSAQHFGGAIIQVANRGYNGVGMRDDVNSYVQLQNRFGKIKHTIWYSQTVASQSMALTRSPDLTGEWGDVHSSFYAPGGAFVHPALHLDVSDTFELYSAGRRLNGTPFPGNGLVASPVAATYRHAEMVDWQGYSLGDEFGIIYTGAWPWAWHYDLGRWVLPLAGGASGAGDAEGTLFLYDAASNGWLYTQQRSVYPQYYDYAAGTWDTFD